MPNASGSSAGRGLPHSGGEKGRAKMNDEQAFRFHKNVPGPFYTTGECLACGLPEHEAPELLASLDAEDNPKCDTYFIRQPETPEEVEKACRALEVCCVDDLRYGGTDPAIIRRLGNDPRYCDYLLEDIEETGDKVQNDR